MTLPASGVISIEDIAIEFGGTVPHALTEYYGAGGAPGSGTISNSDFYGLSAQAGTPGTLTASNYNPPPSSSVTLYWGASSTPGVTYHIYRNGSPWSTTTSLSKSTGGFISVTYNYKVKAVKAGYIDSAFTNTVNITWEGTSCFTGDTLVLMVDGTEKYIRDIISGEYVIGLDGKPVKVLALQKTPRDGRDLVGIQGQSGRPVRLTTEHPMMRDDRTWGMYSLSAYVSEMNAYRSGTPIWCIKDGKPAKYANEYPDEVFDEFIGKESEQLRLGDRLMTLDGKGVDSEPIMTYTPHEDAELYLYSLITDDSHTYTVDGIVCSGFRNTYDYDYENGCPRADVQSASSFTFVDKEEAPEWLLRKD